MRYRFSATCASLLLAASCLDFAVAQPAGPAAYQPPNFSMAAAQQAAPLPGGGLVRAVQTAIYHPELMDAHGNPVVLPASYGPGAPCPPQQFQGPVCPACCLGPVGKCPCGYNPPHTYGGDTGDLSSAAALGIDQSGPHYFDLRVDAVYMTRDETFGRSIDITSLNISNDFRLNTGDLDYDYEPGFRILGRYDIGPLSVFEFGYMGIFDWEDSAEFEDPMPNSPTDGNLYSLFSAFGTNPAGGAGMPETEQAVRHRISISSDLQTAELTYRRYCVGYSPRISGTWLAGARFTRLQEGFLFHSAANGTLDYNINAENDLVGFQAGGDIWMTIHQGLRIGGEFKAGIFNNRFDLDTRISTDPPAGSPPDLEESFNGDNLAFLSEASIDIVADICPSISVRAGVEGLFINSIVLAGDNFNTASPYAVGAGAPREPFLWDQSHAFFYGAHASLEYVW